MDKSRLQELAGEILNEAVTAPVGYYGVPDGGGEAFGVVRPFSNEKEIFKYF